MAPHIQKVLKEYWLKWTLSVRNYSSVVLTISSGPIDFEKSYVWRWEHHYRVNENYIEDHYEWSAKDCLIKLRKILWWFYEWSKEKNYNNSDIMTDYFDVGWYIDIQIGKRDESYTLQ